LPILGIALVQMRNHPLLGFDIAFAEGRHEVEN
jgi:hypothetical protein